MPVGFLIVVLVMSVAGTAAQAAAQDLPPALSDRFSEGVSALKAGNLDAAESAFRDVLKEGGNRAFVHHNLGIVLQQRGRHEQAIAEFRAALQLEPTFAPAQLLAGVSLLALGRIAGATAELERAAGAMPAEPSVHLTLADAYERGHNVRGMVDQYRQLRALSPSNADYIYRLGKAYLKLAQWSFEQMRQVNPGTARLPQALAQQYLDQDQLDLAGHALMQAAKRDPALDEVHLALARIYAQQGKLDEAKAEIGRELAIAPASAAARALQAEIDSAARPR